MSQMVVKKFESPDETRPFVDKGRAELLSFEEGAVGRAIFEPGWKWSEHVKPLAGTESCEAPHVCYIASGRLHVEMDDGDAYDLGPGDVAVIPPGHDAWVVGDEPCVFLDFHGMGEYAQRGAERRAGQPAVEEAPAVH
jgi:quercetin dioxygenase-like cupin family protein